MVIGAVMNDALNVSVRARQDLEPKSSHLTL
jgi:hypothetical protein